MNKLDHSDEIFEFLYNLSVGFERLLKISIVLFEHNSSIDQEELEKSLITHSHLDLLSRLKKHTEVNLGSPQIAMLCLLGRFYKSYRYDRFTIGSVYEGEKEKRAIIRYIEKHLEVDISNEHSFMGVENTERYKKFISRTCLKISRILYAIIKEKSGQLNLYTYELRSGSKAESVFLREVNVSDEDVLWKELLIFFMNTKSHSGYLEFLRGIEPLEFDPGLVDEYLDCFKSDSSKAFVMDELEHNYTEMEGKVGERLELMGVIGASGLCFDSDEEYLDENE
jgi:hypothetical protein